MDTKYERNKSEMHESNEQNVEMKRIEVSISISKPNKLFILSAILPHSQFVAGSILFNAVCMAFYISEICSRERQVENDRIDDSMLDV